MISYDFCGIFFLLPFFPFFLALGCARWGLIAKGKRKGKGTLLVGKGSPLLKLNLPLDSGGHLALKEGGRSYAVLPLPASSAILLGVSRALCDLAIRHCSGVCGGYRSYNVVATFLCWRRPALLASAALPFRAPPPAPSPEHRHHISAELALPSSEAVMFR